MTRLLRPVLAILLVLSVSAAWALEPVKRTNPGLSTVTGIPKGDGAGSYTPAVPGTDYQAATPPTNVTSSATPTPAVGTAGASIQYNLTALSQAAAFGVPTGTPVNGQKLVIRIKDNGTARALDFTAAAIYRAVGTTLPTTTVISKTLYIGAVYNAADTKWDVLAVGQE